MVASFVGGLVSRMRESGYFFHW
ncbi:hypothetical protein XAP412_1150005 [Xanthomonas phaseoli pv. phaseoli]|uniref:Uncharacterized protein n=1 Tax=Xanthomonas campestris pv. phaseoli TaxID=317013 RepID=A0AB38DWF0_XANCH|nr:hypothetical protein XAP412_1150005 [Xanthomonas phaseoli pv. phaseoli]SON77923.1 hypothetical protein XAP6984_1510002 [Xanthomonas phaseoli pv. phaseoli]SON83464.1 hypothetical protein XAP7430_1440002 [Xanthomonas phaseoli pv. phaseoli]